MLIISKKLRKGVEMQSFRIIDNSVEVETDARDHASRICDKIATRNYPPYTDERKIKQALKLAYKEAYDNFKKEHEIITTLYVNNEIFADIQPYKVDNLINLMCQPRDHIIIDKFLIN